MEGVTTACLLFIFLCLVLPSLIQNKNQYYVAFIAILGVMFVDAIDHMIPATSVHAACYVLAVLGQIIAVVMLFLATGGLTFRALHGDMIEVLRRGEEEKEVIIPLSEEAKQTIRANQEQAAKRPRPAADEEHKVFTIDDPGPRPSSAPPPTPTPKAPPSTDPLPLD